MFVPCGFLLLFVPLPDGGAPGTADIGHGLAGLEVCTAVLAGWSEPVAGLGTGLPCLAAQAGRCSGCAVGVFTRNVRMVVVVQNNYRQKGNFESYFGDITIRLVIYRLSSSALLFLQVCRYKK